jgi:hypothetical protein
MKTYRGVREPQGAVVTVSHSGASDGRPLPLYSDVCNHSPSGFEWGFQGSGPTQLALAILVDLRGRDFAVQWYQLFKFHVIAQLKHQQWELNEAQINAALAEITAGAPTEEEGADADDVIWEPIGEE